MSTTAWIYAFNNYCWMMLLSPSASGLPCGRCRPGRAHRLMAQLPSLWSSVLTRYCNMQLIAAIVLLYPVLDVVHHAEPRGKGRVNIHVRAMVTRPLRAIWMTNPAQACCEVLQHYLLYTLYIQSSPVPRYPILPVVQ